MPQKHGVYFRIDSNSDVNIQDINRPRLASETSIGWFFSTSQDRPAMKSDDLKNGVFSHFLNRGLLGEADLNDDHTLTFRELVDFVSSETGRYVGDRYRNELSWGGSEI